MPNQTVRCAVEMLHTKGASSRKPPSRPVLLPAPAPPTTTTSGGHAQTHRDEALVLCYTVRYW